MNPISHKQAVQWIHRRLDGLLTQKQLLVLEEHLHSCDTCRAYASEMDALPARLQNEFHTRWDEKPGPSPKIMQTAIAQARNIPMRNRISSGIKLFAGAAALILLGVAINFMVSQLRGASVAANGTEIANVSPGAADRLLAFVSDQNGNFDIYAIRVDGNNLTNLTDDPAYDGNPIWSPDGKRIAFESDRSGISQIYLMDADGSNVTQLTMGEAAHYLPINVDGITYPWSPDGNKILYLQNHPGEKVSTLISQDLNGENTIPLVTGQLYYNGVSWSPDGNHIGYLLDGSPDSPPLDPDILVMDTNGSNARKLQTIVPHTERLDSRYRWTSAGESIIFTAVRFDPARSTAETIVYEYELESNTLVQQDNLQEMKDWEESTNLVTWFRSFERAELIAVRQFPDGKGSLFDVDSQCSELNVKSSASGSLAIGASCPDNQFKLYWANSDRSMVKQLLTLPVDAAVDNPGDISWSPDDRYIALNLESSGQTTTYIVDAEKALADPSHQPVQVAVNNNEAYSIPAWQPIRVNKVAEEEPTPVVTSRSSDRLLAFASTQNGNSDIYTMRADGSGLANLTNDPADDGYPFWSPDGKQIAFISDRSGSAQIYLMNADGSNLLQLTDGEGNSGFDVNGYSPWSPDGTQLVFVNKLPEEQDMKLYVMNIHEKTSINLTNEPGKYLLPSWAPDGERIAFMYYVSEANSMMRHLFVVDKDGNQLTELTESLRIDETDTALILNYSWSRDGMSVFFTSARPQETTTTVYEASLDGSLTVINEVPGRLIVDWWDGTTLHQAENARTLTWLRADGSQITLDLCQSHDQIFGSTFKRSYSGNLIFGANCSAGGWTLYWANPNGTIINKLLDYSVSSDKDGLFNMTWSPDDHFIAFVATNLDPSNVTHTLYVLDVEQARNNSPVQPLKVEASYAPSWQPVINNQVVKEEPTPVPPPSQTDSPNLLLAFASVGENGNLDIYTMHPDGSRLTNLTEDSARDANPFWSPDGKQIAFESDRDGFTHIFLMDANGSNLRRLTNGEAQHQFSNINPWSPDGSKLLFTEWTPTEEKWMLSVIGVDGQHKTPLGQVPNNYSSASWSPDGQHIAFLADDPQNLGGDRLYVVDTDGQNLREITASLQVNEQLSTFNYDWSEEGQSIFFVSFLQKTDPSWTVYEARLDDNSLTERATINAPILDWWNDVSVMGSLNDSSTITWTRANETISILHHYENCEPFDAAQSGFYMKRSPKGTWLISTYCPNGDAWFYWVSSDGTIAQQLLDLPIPSEQDTFSELVWSPDEKFVAFNVFSDNLTEMYILDVEASLHNPATQPLKTTVGGGRLFSNPSWQPAP